MKKNTLYIGLIILCFSLYYCKENINIEYNKNNDLYEYSLYGKVKSIEETQFNVSEKFGDINKDSIKEKTLKTYNKIGNNIECITFNSNGGIDSKVTKIYNDSQKVIEIKTVDKDGKIIYRALTSYDERGNIVEYKRYSIDGSLSELKEYKYDSFGHKIEDYIWNRAKKGVSPQYSYYRTIYKYDKSGNLIESKNKSEGYFITPDIYYKYDNNGNNIEYIEYMFGKLDFKKYGIFNSRNKKIEGTYYTLKERDIFEKNLNYNKKTLPKIEYYKNKTKYKYDNKDSLIEFININEDGSLKRKININYYPNGLKKDYSEVEVTSTGDSLWIINKYNVHGKEIFFNDYNTSTSFLHKRTTKYNNKIIEEESDYFMGHDKEFIYNYLTKFDNVGNKIEYIKYDSLDYVVEKQKFKYEYDKKYNWTKKTEYTNGIPIKITEREIKYY